MKRWIGWAAGLSVLVLTGAQIRASRTFLRHVDNLIDSLDGRSTPPRQDSVPQIVREFVARAGPAEPVPTRVKLRQRCQMRFAPDGDWHAVDAEQTIRVGAPGFVWLAETQMVPFVRVRVVDALVDDRGLLDVRLFGSLPIARSTGPDTDRGELMRYLAELPWAPHAILHNPGLSFRLIEPKVVEVSAGEPTKPATVRWIFEHGDIVRVEADGRPHDEGNGVIVDRPWEGSFHDYQILGGIRVPRRAEVGWRLDSGLFNYWRGEILELTLLGPS